MRSSYQNKSIDWLDENADNGLLKQIRLGSPGFPRTRQLGLEILKYKENYKRIRDSFDNSIKNMLNMYYAR